MGLISTPVVYLTLGSMLAVLVAEDVLYRRIRNFWVVVFFILWCGLSGLVWMKGAGDGTYVVWTILGSMGVLLAGLVLFQFGLMGGGDVKLMAVLSLWVGHTQLLTFLIVTSLAGGVLVVLVPVLRPAEYMLANIWWALVRRLPETYRPDLPHCLSAHPSMGLPYGLAIATGASFTLFCTVVL